jgi:hypothetical protein
MKPRTLGLLLGPLLLFGTGMAAAATINVVNSEESGSGCNLRDAIRAANADAARGDCTAGSGADTIRLTPSSSNIRSALPTINTPMTIESATANAVNVYAVDTLTGLFRVFDVSNASLTLNRVRVRNGQLQSVTASGGAGIRVQNGTLTLNQSEVAGNTLISTSNGGAGILALSSDVTINESSIVDNNAGPTGDGVIRPSGAGMLAVDSTVSILRSTLARNTTYAFSHSLVFDNSIVTVEQSYLEGPTPIAARHIELRNNSILGCVNSTLVSTISSDRVIDLDHSEIAFTNCTVLDQFIIHDSNSSGSFANTIFTGSCYPVNFTAAGVGNFFTEPECTGSVTVGDLWLFPVDDYGGPTLSVATHPLSDTINTGSNSNCPAVDQRGEPRDSACDIGAFEYIANADIQISAVPVTAAPYYAGQNILLHINLYNAGADSANFVRVNLDFDHLNVLSISGACVTNPCEIFGITAGAPPTTISVEVSPFANAMNNFGVTATASKGPDAVYNELNPANNVSSITRSLVNVADLSISKTLITPPPYSIGQSITHQLVVENLGPSAAASIVVADTPENLTVTGISNCSNPPAGPCTFGALGVGSTQSLNVTSTITAATFNNIAAVTSQTADVNSANNVDQFGNGGSAQIDADLRVILTRNTAGPYYNGQFVQYSAQVDNAGPDIATSVVMQIDTENLFITGVTGNCGPNVLPCEVGNLGFRSSAFITVQGQVLSSGPVVVNLHAESDQTDGNLANNVESDSFVAQRAADIQASLTLLTPPPHNLGQVLRYRMVTTNVGVDYATGVEPEISPVNLDILSVVGGQCLELPCYLPILGLLENETIEILATPRAIGPFDMTARAAGNEFDPLGSNNIDADGNGGMAEMAPGDQIFADAFELVPP